MSDLRTEEAYLHHQLNHDSPTFFFVKIRLGGHTVNPTPTQFIIAFSKLPCMELMACVSDAGTHTLLLEKILEKGHQRVNQHSNTSLKVF